MNWHTNFNDYPEYIPTMFAIDFSEQTDSYEHAHMWNRINVHHFAARGLHNLKDSAHHTRFTTYNISVTKWEC